MLLYNHGGISLAYHFRSPSKIGQTLLHLPRLYMYLDHRSSLWLSVNVDHSRFFYVRAMCVKQFPVIVVP